MDDSAQPTSQRAGVTTDTDDLPAVLRNRFILWGQGENSVGRPNDSCGDGRGERRRTPLPSLARACCIAPLSHRQEKRLLAVADQRLRSRRYRASSIQSHHFLLVRIHARACHWHPSVHLALLLRSPGERYWHLHQASQRAELRFAWGLRRNLGGTVRLDRIFPAQPAPDLAPPHPHSRSAIRGALSGVELLLVAELNRSHQSRRTPCRRPNWGRVRGVDRSAELSSLAEAFDGIDAHRRPTQQSKTPPQPAARARSCYFGSRTRSTGTGPVTLSLLSSTSGRGASARDREVGAAFDKNLGARAPLAVRNSTEIRSSDKKRRNAYSSAMLVLRVDQP